MDFEIDFMPVGDSYGDAICLRYGHPLYGYAVDVIDGGYSDTGEAVVQHLRNYWGTSHINNLTLTHADDDHSAGLIKVMEACSVKTLRMNRPWLYADDILNNYHLNFTRHGLIERLREAHPHLVELESLAAMQGTDVRPIFRGDTFGCFTVLAPSRERYVRLIAGFEKGPEALNAPDSYARFSKNALDSIWERFDFETLQEKPTPPTSASNESSVVQLARFGDYNALFTGDAGPDGLVEAALFAFEQGLLKKPHLFQIPHQGSRHNVTPTALNLWLGPPLRQPSCIGWAACSVGANKTDYPRKIVTNALHRRGFMTQIARHGVLSYSNRSRDGWSSAPIIPFHDCIEDAA